MLLLSLLFYCWLLFFGVFGAGCVVKSSCEKAPKQTKRSALKPSKEKKVVRRKSKKLKREKKKLLRLRLSKISKIMNYTSINLTLI